METNAKAYNFVNALTPEFRKMIVDISETLKPLLDDIHASYPTTQNYYGDYLRLLSYKPEKAKIIALALLFAGANPQGIEAAMKLI